MNFQQKKAFTKTQGNPFIHIARLSSFFSTLPSFFEHIMIGIEES